MTDTMPKKAATNGIWIEMEDLQSAVSAIENALVRLETEASSFMKPSDSNPTSNGELKVDRVSSNLAGQIRDQVNRLRSQYKVLNELIDRFDI